MSYIKKQRVLWCRFDDINKMFVKSLKFDYRVTKKNVKYFTKIKLKKLRACSSVVERFVDIEEVISSILITPTKNPLNKEVLGVY